MSAAQAFGRESPAPPQRLVVSGRREDLNRVELAVMAALEAGGYNRASCFAIRLALAEALTNALTHGHRLDESRPITVEYAVTPEQAVIEVIDSGEGFDPAAVPDPTEPENVEIPSGRGIVLMKAYMTEVVIHPPGNRVRMTFSRK